MAARHFGIVGAGAGGLTAAKHLLDAGFDVTIYELGSRVGGMWVYQNDNNRSSAYKTLHINTARDLTAFSDLPFADDVQPFPNHWDMARYLGDYERRFGLTQHIRFKTRVVDVRPAPGYTADNSRWVIETDTGDVFEHDRVIIASGHLTKPLHVPMFQEQFKGDYLHSHYYREPVQHSGKRVCIVGVGNSALDIACDLAPTGERTVLVARSRPLIIPKLMFGRPFWETAKLAYKPWIPAAVRNRFLKFLVWTVQGDLGRVGFPPASKKVHATSNANIVNHLHYRRVVVKNGIDAIDGRMITFNDGSKEEFDTLIAATGYLIDLDFVEPEVVAIKDNSLDLYMRIVPPQWRGLYFLGFFNSDTAANWIMEGQIRWIREFELGRAALPTEGEMRAEIEARRAKVAADFKDTPRHGIEVEHIPYFADLRATLKQAHKRAGTTPRDVGIGVKAPSPVMAA